MSPTSDTKTIASHPYAHARWNKPSARKRLEALQAGDKSDLKQVKRRSKRARLISEKLLDEQTALYKYRVALECYNEEYQDEILTYMHKNMVRPLD